MDDWKSIWNSASSFSHTTWTLCKFWTQCSFHHLRMFNFLSLHSLTKLAENYKQGQLKKRDIMTLLQLFTWKITCATYSSQFGQDPYEVPFLCLFNVTRYFVFKVLKIPTLGVSPSLISRYCEGCNFWGIWGPYIKNFRIS